MKKKGGGGGLKISEYFHLYFLIPAEIQCMHDSVNIYEGLDLNI